ncbi:YCF48-related protein [Pontibacter pudoricolor]|uniref:YCF48-related protein n=1 Tax=Pontibacter pudoricolor TaxID=2694930 RepID=UPI001392059A|nr:YCF48-related protein [Pontibacter pudoricolor]
MKTKLLLLVHALLTLTLSSASAQWKWLNPEPSGNTGQSITFTDAQNGFILSGTQLLQTQDAGITWSVKQEIASSNEIRFKDNAGYIVGNNGYVLQTLNQGEFWQKLAVNTQENINTVNILHADTIYLTSNKSLLKSTDGGANWNIVTIQAPNTSPLTVTKSFFLNSKVGHAVCNNGYILKTINGGTSWYVTESVNFFPAGYFTVYFVNSKVGFASRAHSAILKTTDGGESWFELPNTTDAIYSFSFLTESIGYITGDHGVIHKTTDGGATWQWVGFQNGRIAGSSMYGIHFTDENVGYATGMRGRIIKTTDGGKTWKENSFTYNNINDMHFPTNTTGYALGSELYKTTDKGENWTTINTGLDESYHYYRLAQFFSADTGYVVTHQGLYSNSVDQLLRTNDGGTTWTKLKLHTYGIRISSMHFLNQQIGYVCTDSWTGNGFLKTINGGVTWQKVSGFTGAKKIHFINMNQGVAIRYGDLYTTTDGGINWIKVHEVYGDFTDISFVDEKVGYISAEYNTVLKTEDGGSTWTELKTEYDHLQTIAFYNANIGYVTGEYGRNFKTSDGGLTWQSFDIPHGITNLSITKDKDIFGSGFSGRILKGALSYEEYVLNALTASELAADGATLTAIAASNGDPLTNIKIEYGVAGSLDKSINLTPTDVSPNTSKKFKLSVGDLQPNTTYYYRVKALYKGVEVTSQLVKFSTLPAFTINMDYTYYPSSNEAKVSCQVTSQLGEITNIQFEYANNQTFENATYVHATPNVVASKTSSHVSAQLQRLEPATRYFVRLKINSFGKVYYSSPTAFYTKPEYVINMQPPVVSATDIKWTARIDANKDAITDIVFEYGKTLSFGNQVASTPNSVLKDRWQAQVQVTLAELDRNAIYYYRIKAKQTGKVIYSAVNLFKATGGVLVETSKAENITGASALLTGLVAPQGSLISNLQFEYGETDALGNSLPAAPNYLYSATTSNVKAEVRSLLPVTGYFYRLKGTVNGETLYGDIKRFSTIDPNSREVLDRKLDVYPNPVQDRLYLSHPENIQKIEVLDQVGKIILHLTPNAKNYELDLSTKVAGIYFLRVYSESFTHIRKIIKP